MRPSIKKAILITSCLLLILFGYSDSTADHKARTLLKEYNLHPLKRLGQKEITLREDFAAWLVEPSADIGLHINKFTGKTVKQLSYLLKETSQFNNCRGPIRAYVYVSEKNEVVSNN